MNDEILFACHLTVSISPARFLVTSGDNFPK